MSTTPETLDRTALRGAPARWKAILGHVSAVLLGLLFLVSGIWKLWDLPGAAERMVQSLIPVALSTPVAALVGVAEVFAAVLLLWPAWRRWGAYLAALMLVAFMVYIGVFYQRLLGEDCNCFPWIRRVVGPWFFISDAAMLALAVLAGWWSRRPRGWRAPACVLAGLLVLAAGSWTVSAVSRSGIAAPATIQVEGKPLRLHEGRFLLYFFDPECSHCLKVAREMSRQSWRDARVIAVATAQPQFAADFLNDAGLRAEISNDADVLRQTFRFTDSPYAVALVNGRQAAAFNYGHLEGEPYYQKLRELGFIR